jgi:hypothetical protein
MGHCPEVPVDGASRFAASPCAAASGQSAMAATGKILLSANIHGHAGSVRPDLGSRPDAATVLDAIDRRS